MTTVSASATTYMLEDFFRIMETMPSNYTLSDDTLQLIQNIDQNVTPIIVEKQYNTYNNNNNNREYTSNSTRPPRNNNNHHHSSSHGQSRSPNKKRTGRNRNQSSDNENWETVRTVFKTTVIEKANDEGVDKLIQDIRSCINKISNKNYDKQSTNIIEYIDKCVENKDESSETDNKENLKKIANFIFSVASTNKFYVDLYATLYVELIEKYDVFQELLLNYLNTYVNTLKDLRAVDPNQNYELYCQYIKQNEMRRASSVFIVRLVEKGKIPVLRLLNIMVAFQEQSNEMIKIDDNDNDVHEIAETLYLFIQEGKKVFHQCKDEWIWKFVILPHVQNMCQSKTKGFKSVSSRTLFKYMDIQDLLNQDYKADNSTSS